MRLTLATLVTLAAAVGLAACAGGASTDPGDPAGGKASTAACQALGPLSQGDGCVDGVIAPCDNKDGYAYMNCDGQLSCECLVAAPLTDPAFNGSIGKCEAGRCVPAHSQACDPGARSTCATAELVNELRGSWYCELRGGATGDGVCSSCLQGKYDCDGSGDCESPEPCCGPNAVRLGGQCNCNPGFCDFDADLGQPGTNGCESPGNSCAVQSW